MKPVILLTGKNGQVGGELLRVLPRLGEVVAFGHEQLDLSKPADICRTIHNVRPQLIINAAAYTAVDRAEADTAMASVVNAEAPGLMANEAKKIGAVLVHYSTDYIFDGQKNSPYDEADSANPINVYGKTKLAGEQAIRSSGVAHLIFRTAWVYSTRGRNFLLAILRLATEHEELKMVFDQTGSPTRALDLAAATTHILKNAYAQGVGSFAFRAVSGTYNMTAAGETTWFDFAKVILREAAQSSQGVPWLAAATRGRPLIARRVVPITTAEYGAPAQRPKYSVLSNFRLAQTFGIALSDWRSQLRDNFGKLGEENPTADFENIGHDDCVLP
jgi:dTDP-4-dehydrorhamnose reductase